MNKMECHIIATIMTRYLIFKMLINSEDKKNFILDFLKSMKKHPDFTIFAHFNPLAYGFFDLDYITRTPIISLDGI